MGRRGKRVDVVELVDVDLLERVLCRDDLDTYEADAFENMLGTLRRRADEYGDDAYPLTDMQREWAHRVSARAKTRMTGEEFVEMVRVIIGRNLRL